MRFTDIKIISAVAALALGMGVAAAGAQTLRVVHVDPADWQNSKKGAAAEIVKNIVDGETDLTVELFPAGALGNEDELVAQAQDGITQVVLVSGAMSKVCPAASVLDIPYTFPSAPVAWDVLDGEFGDALWLGSCPIPDDHIDPRRSALFMARSLLGEVRDAGRGC